MTRTPAARTQPSNYPWLSPVIARYADVDPFWHLNNVAIATYFEDARIAFVMMLLEIRQPTGPDGRVLLARSSIDYLHEGRWPGTLQAGAAIAAVGRTSVTISLGLFQESRCIAVSDAVIVKLGESGPAPWSEAQRARLGDRQWGLRAG